MTSTLGTGERVPINFLDVPEISYESLPSVLTGLHRSDRSSPSFGALVIRKAGPTIARGIIDTYRGNTEGDDFDSMGSNLHTDTTKRGEHIDVTSYVIKRGSVEAIVLAGVHIAQRLSSISNEETDLLFEDSSIDPTIILLDTPNKLIRTTLAMDDVLIFDHSQPHAFKQHSIESRKATAFYVTEKIIR